MGVVRRRLAAVLAVSAITSTAACGTGGVETADGDLGPVIRLGHQGDDAPTALIRGRLTRSGDCLLLGTEVAVWPTAARWDATTQSVEVGGFSFTAGDMVTGGGGGYQAEGPFGSDMGAQAARQIGECATATGATGAAVLYTFPDLR